MRRIFSILLPVIAVLSGCTGNPQSGTSASAGKNLLHARRLTLEKEDGFTRVRIINPWQRAGNVSLEYYLVKRGSALPQDMDSSQVIFVPLKKVICMSVTHAAMISALGEEGTISAVSGRGLVYSEELRARFEKGEIPDVGYEAGLNNELILKISPDLVMMYGVGGESAGYVSKIRELGIKVLFNADYLETDALAKAEWIKLLGALYCKEQRADSIFNEESRLYDEVLRSAAHPTGRPKVLLGLPYKDIWYISPGNSYISNLIADAGGEYLWSGTDADEAMPFGLENVYMRALDADFWLNAGTASSLNEILAVDPRFSELPCFRSGNVFNNNKRLNETGGNDYWETGSVHPHLILRDIAMILHPELFGNGDSLIFYKQLR